MEKTSQILNVKPIDLCNKNVELFKKMNADFEIRYDYFIRTTQQEHIQTVHDAITTSHDNSDIYLTNYTGFYDVRNESYITEYEAKNTEYKDPITQAPYESISEETYNFKLSKYKNQIIREDVYPLQFQNIHNERIRNLKDVSITRTSCSWAIPCILNDKHTIYVWFDALLNYVTGSKILFPHSNPATVHIIGKDITWFHSVIYPAILYSSKLTNYLPGKILVHGFVVDKNGLKMSKSIGNGIEVNDLLQKYPIDSIRYYFLSETIFGEDFCFSDDILKAVYNNELIKSYGNLYQRILGLLIPCMNYLNDELILDYKKISLNYINDLINYLDFKLYKERIYYHLAIANKMVSDTKPWTLEIKLRIPIILDILNQLLISSFLLSPLIPSKINELMINLGINLCEDKIRIKIVKEKYKAFTKIE